MATATGAPVYDAMIPGLTSPSWEPPVNLECAAATRLSSWSGAGKFRKVGRCETLTASAAPLAARKAREQQIAAESERGNAEPEDDDRRQDPHPGSCQWVPASHDRGAGNGAGGRRRQQPTERLWSAAEDLGREDRHER